MKDKAILRYRPQSTIFMPSKVELVGEKLCWGPDAHLRLPSSQREGDEFHIIELVERPVDGLLHDFIALENASAKDILAFTLARGVLAIDPLVYVKGGAERIAILDACLNPVFSYQELTSVYWYLASRFGAVVRLMNALKEGRKIDGDLALEFIYFSGVSDINTLSPLLQYETLWSIVSHCWTHATIPVMPTVSGLKGRGLVARREEEPPDPNRSGTPLPGRPEMSILFGAWEDGSHWDMVKSSRTHMGPDGEPDGTVTPRDEYLGAFSPETAIPEGQSEEMEGEGYSQSSSGEWVKPYTHYMTDAGYQPHSASRPSALYNALVFQLMLEVTLEEDTYFCSQCNKPYLYDPEKARKPKPGESSSEYGNSKPRRGRPTAFCCWDCRRNYDTADRSRSRAAAKFNSVT